jgi:hypothetical protein
MKRNVRAYAFVCLMTGAIFACKRETEAPPQAAPAPAPTTVPAPAAAPLRVVDVAVGNNIASDKTILNVTQTFAENDTFYVSVRTDGSASRGTLQAVWTYEDGQVVKQDSMEISTAGPAVHEFHVSRPSGWPFGRYKVEIMLNGMPVGSKEFEVR